MLRAGRLTVRLDRATANRIASDHGLLLVADVTRKVLNRAVMMTPVRYGNLRGHNKMRAAVKAPPGARGEVYNDADYAVAVHEGSGPHTIRPKRKKALRFQIGGRTVIVKSVRHPGTRARPWLARAGEQVARQEGFRWDAGR